MGAYERHHFVPQFYLRHFAADQKQRQIGLYIIPSGLFIRSTSIKGQAQRQKLYGTQGGEQALSTLEGAAAAVIKRVVERREVPKWHGQDHFTLLIHVLFQTKRTPTAGEELKEASEQMVKMIASLDQRMAPHADEIRLSWPNVVMDSLGMAALFHPIMMDMRYKLLINASPIPFATSDNPVVLYNQFMERRRKFGSGTGLACKGLQAFLPLSPKCCLVLFDYDVYKVGGRSATGVQVPVTAEDVTALNLLQAANAGEHLFFNSAMSEQEIKRTIAAAAPFRPAALSAIKAYHAQPAADGSSSVLLHSSRVDLRAGLQLSNVSELKTARDYRLGNRVVHQRDPVLCALHREFIEKVQAGKYRNTEFGRFVADEEKAAQREEPSRQGHVG